MVGQFIPEEVRLAVLERADFCCERCGKPANHRKPALRDMGLDMHHVNSKGWDHRVENLLLVCEPCHAQEHRFACFLCGRLVSMTNDVPHFEKCLRQKLERLEPIPESTWIAFEAISDAMGLPRLAAQAVGFPTRYVPRFNDSKPHLEERSRKALARWLEVYGSGRR